MSAPLGTLVDWSALGQVVLASFAGGVGVTVLVSLAIAGAAHSMDARRAGSGVAATVLGIGAAVALAACAAAVVGGILLMTAK